MALASAHWRVTLLMLMACAVAAAQTRPATDRAGGDDGEPPETALVPATLLQIVDVDRAIEDRLKEVAQWLTDKRYDESIDALHALMVSQDNLGLQSASSDGRRYCGSVEAAARMIGSLPDEALDLYCRRHATAADKLFETARAKRDEPALLAVGERYFHTPAGAAALSLAAAIAFDRGEYLKAAGLWERLYREHRRSQADRPTLLAKAAIAYHLADLPIKARALRQLLRQDHASAQTRIAGDRRSLTAFVDEALATPPQPSFTAQKALGNWPAMAGSPGGVGLMADLDPAAVPICTVPNSRSAATAPATGSSGLRITIEDGRVRAARPVPGMPDLRFDVPPLVHPVADSGMVLVRYDDGIVAFSTQTRKDLWRTPDLPLYRDGKASDAMRAQLALAGDMGRNAISLGDGRAYVLARLAPLGHATPGLSDADRGADAAGSMLVAVSIKPEGPSLAWEIGQGKGDCDFLRQAKYLCVPTFSDGRLYLLARLGNRYHAACLDAARGTLHWQTPLGVIPFRGGVTMSGPQVYALEVTTERGSPPAVGNGVVVLTTNAGMVAALDAASGAALWAHRYDSSVGGPASGPTTMDLQGQAIRIGTLRQAYPPINPVILAQGRVTCLPCDGDSVLSLDARTGELLWQQPRENQRDLTALDESTILLSGPDMLVFRAGELQHRESGRILGRPAVTSTGVFACDQGALARLAPARKVVERKPVPHETLLGNALIAGGHLVTVNTTGLSMFCDYQTTWQTLRANVSAAGRPLDRASAAYLAGMVASSADRLDDAAAQLAICINEASKASAPAVAARATRLLFDVHMRRAESSGGPEHRWRCLELAAASATTVAERQRVLLARIRHQEQFRSPDEAMAVAQKAIEARVADWQAGRDFPLVEYLTARSECHRLLRDHRTASYAGHDTQMARSRAEASAAGNADQLVAAARRWPAATQAADAMLDAAEILLKKATAAPRVDAAIGARAGRLAAEAANSSDERTRTRAAAAAAIIDLRCRSALAAARAAQLAAYPATQPVRFAGFDGTVRDLIRGCEAVRPAGTDTDFRALAPPLSFIFSMPPGLAPLRNTRGEVLIAGERLWLVGRRQLVCLDSQRDQFNQAQVWSAELPSPGLDERRIGQLTEDGRRIILIQRSSVLVFDAATGKLLQQVSMDWLGPRGWIRAAGHGDWLALQDDGGRVSGLRLSDGQVAWSHMPPRFDSGSLVARADLLLMSDAGQRRHACVDIRTGRVLVDLGGRGTRYAAHAILTPECFLLSWQPESELWVDEPWTGTSRSAAAWRGADWRVLGAGRRYIGMRADTRCAVLDLANIQRPIELPLDDLRARRLLRMDFYNDRALLLAADDDKGEGLADATIAAFDLPSARLRWQAPVAAADAAACRDVRMAVQGNVAVVSATALHEPAPPRQLVVRLEDGKVYDCAGAIGTDALPAAELPIVLNGRILVPTSEGWACLASLQP